MSKTVYYRQCRLQKKTNEGTLTQVSWLPEPYAATGKVLKLRDEDKNWDNGWVVIGAGSNRLAQSDVPDYHVLIKGHRKATGDSLPK